MKKIILSLILVFGFSFSCFGTEFVVPEQKIESYQNPVPLGEEVDLTVSKISKPTQFLEMSSYEWQVWDKDQSGKKILKRMRTSNDNMNIWCAAGIKARKLDVMLVITHLYIVREKPEDKTSKILEAGAKTVVLFYEVVIGEEPPVPEPPDVPVVFPDGKYQMAKWTYENVLSNVDKTNRSSDAKKLANSFDYIVGAISFGTLKTDEDVLKETKKSNESTLGNDGVERWKTFSSLLQTKLYDLYITGKLKTVDDYKVCWLEISSALKTVK